MQKQKTIKNTLPKNQTERLSLYLEQILIFIYKFRYLNRPQIQKLMNHKYHHNIFTWLNFLSDNKYLRKYTQSKFSPDATFYSLGTKGRKYFLEHPEIEDINHSLLDRVWQERTYSASFKIKCMFLANIFLSLRDLVKKVDNGQGKLHFFSNTDLNGVEGIIYPLPDAYFAIEDKDGNIKTSGKLVASEVKTNKLTVSFLAATIGTATLPASQTKTTVQTKEASESAKVFITPTTPTDKVLSVTNIKNNQSFDVEILIPTPLDINFNWWIVQTE